MVFSRNLFGSLCASCAMVLVWLPNVAVAQVTYVDWVSDSGGLFTDAANWQGGAAPDAGLDQAPRIQATSELTVNLPTDTPLAYPELWAESEPEQSLVLQPADVAAEAAMSIQGQTTIAGGRVEVATLGAVDTAGVHLMTDSLLVTGDGDLSVTGESRLSTSSVEIHVGQTTPTALLLQSGATHALGEVSIGEAGEGTRDANLQVERSGVLTAGNVSVGGVAAPGQTALLQLLGSTLTQDAETQLTVGSGAEDAAARVFVASDSVLSTGSSTTTIARSGEIRNLSSTVNFNGPIVIDGGQYVENAGAQRVLVTAAHVQVFGGGSMDLGEADLMFDEGHTLEMSGDDSLVQMDGDLVLGASSTIDLTFDAYPPDAALISVGCDEACDGDSEALLAGTLRVGFNPGQIPQLGVAFPIIRSTGFNGAFATVDVEPPSPAQAWELVTQDDTLWLTLVEDDAGGDYNGDGVVDAADYAVWRDTVGSQTSLAADGDGDGQVDAGDYHLWRESYLAATAETASTAPEPGALPCCALGLAILPTRWRFA